MINSTTDLKKYISVAENFDFSEIEPYIKKANRTYLKRYIGDLYTSISNMTLPNSLKSEAIELIDIAISNFAYFLFTPYNSIVIDASGMSNVTSQNRSNISAWQLNDIRRELLRSGHEAMDELLELLEKNSDNFPNWESEFGTKRNELIVNSTYIFQESYNIFNSRQTFLALLPSIAQIEDKILSFTFCSELITHLKEGELNDKDIKLKKLLCRATVLATVGKVCNEGIFLLTDSGIKLKFDTLPYEQKAFVELTDQIKNKVQSLNNSSSQYLNMAKKYINDNKEHFSQCNGQPIINNNTGGYQPIITKSILGL